MIVAKRTTVATLLLVLATAGAFQLISPNASASPWPPPSTSCTPPSQYCFPMEQNPGGSSFVSTVQDNNGSLWMAWQSDRRGAGTSNIYYKTIYPGPPIINGTTAALTTFGKDVTPALVQLNNGTVIHNTMILLWAENQTSNYMLVYKRFNVNVQHVGTWSSIVKLVVTPGSDNQLPSMATGPDGSVWLVWTRITGTCPTCTETRQVYYKTLPYDRVSGTYGTWTPETQLTTDTNWNWAPSVSVGKDARVRVAFVKEPASVNSQLYIKTYDGTSWSTDAPIPMSDSTHADTRPSLMQDRNGTLWIYWTRQTVSGGFYDYDIYGKSSTNLGVSWDALDARMTPSHGSFHLVDEYPSAVQANVDKSIWVFYTTNTALVGRYDIYALRSNPVAPIHDIRVDTASPNATMAYPGAFWAIGQSPTIQITVTIDNPGDFVENVNLSVSVTNVTSILVGVQTGSISPGQTQVYYFNWNTTNVKPARYGISAVLTPPVGESPQNRIDDSLSLTNQIHLWPLGDMDQDGSVTIIDIGVFFFDYNAIRGVPGSRYNPYCDIINTGIINIVDIGIVLANYNTFT